MRVVLRNCEVVVDINSTPKDVCTRMLNDCHAKVTNGKVQFRFLVSHLRRVQEH